MANGLSRSFGFAALVALGTLGAPVVANASLISLGASSQSWLFQTNLSPPGTVSVSTNGSAISGPATFDGDSGAYNLAITSFIVGPQSGNQFPAGSNTEGFTYTGLFPDTDKLTGTITWTFIQDGTPTPHFFGNLKVNTVMGDPAFMAAFTSGETLLIDFITQALTGGNTLETIAGTTPLRATALVGSGSVNTPLPTALPLFATGIGGLGLLGWRRKRKALAVA